MTLNDAFLIQMTEGHRMLNVVMRDVTAEMRAWQPPGNVVPLGAIYAHAVGVEDLYIQQIISNQPLLWETGGWAARLGQELAPNQWNIHRCPEPDRAAFDEYMRAVFQNSEDFVQNLGASDFDRPLQFPGRAWSMTIAQLLAVVIAHTTSHAGEIAVLKGLQGASGLPF